VRRTDGKLFEALDHIDEFLASNHEAMNGALTAEARAFFSSNREKLERYMNAQEAHARGAQFGIVAKQKLRKELVRKHMRPITAIAGVVLSDAREIGALAVPTRGRSYASVVTAAYGMAEAAKVHEAALRNAGLPADFIAKLVGAADALRVAAKGSKDTSGLRVEARAAAAKQARLVRRFLRGLDALVRAAIGDDGGLLERWTHISRVASRAVSSRPQQEAQNAEAPARDAVEVPSQETEKVPADDAGKVPTENAVEVAPSSAAAAPRGDVAPVGIAA
jgi:hypothetical protein